MTTALLAGTVRTRLEHVWSTVVTLDVRDEHATDAGVDAAWQSVVAELHRIDRVFSTFRDDSAISRLRRGGTQVVADDVAEVIDRCLEARRLTDGAFDPWAAPGGFDPSGLVKGWAADRCADIVRQHGFRSFTIDAAGDLACRGSVPGATDHLGWPIGIAHPDDPLAVAAVVDVRDARHRDVGREPARRARARPAHPGGRARRPAGDRGGHRRRPGRRARDGAARRGP